MNPLATIVLALAALAPSGFAVALSQASQPKAAASAPSMSVREKILALEHEGDARPSEAADALDRLAASTPPFSAERLELLAVRGVLLAGTSDPEQAEKVAQTLDGWARSPAGPAAASAAALVRARLLSMRGSLHKADSLAAEALARLPADATPRMRYRVLATVAKVKDDAGKLEDAVRVLHELMRLADGIGDPWRRAAVRSNLAYVYYEVSQMDRARSLNAEALAIARAAGDRTAMGRIHNVEAILLDKLGDREGGRREMQAAIDHARAAGARADEALYLANLADNHLKLGEYKTALTVAEQTLPLVRELKDINGEVVALANIGLAHIAMKNVALGKRYMNEAIAIEEKRGAITGVAASLDELGQYLERAGDVAGAVQAFHRHRELSDEILQRDQHKAIVELQERFDAERRTRDLDLLQRENALKSEQLRQRDLQQRLWWLLAATLVLSVAVLLLLYRRVKRSNRALETSNFQLLVQSERDPLTGLANRRHFQAAMKQLAEDGKLAGTVFLIDIDHFKRINDTHGHAAGDAVLTDVARRLRDTLREQDLIVRWGGEEFLVIVRTLASDQVESLARRMLHAMAGAPVVHDGERVQVTGSIGYATFPIAPTMLAVSWERAINLVDTAMYLAKAHGRNRAYGVRVLHAQSESQLDDITRSLETAWRDGQVDLTLLTGPSASSEAVA